MKSKTKNMETAMPKRFDPQYNTGLSQLQVEERKLAGLDSSQLEPTVTTSQIVFRNVFTLFNLLNIVLAAIILFLGHWKNALFIGVAFANTFIGIFQELRAKKTIDSLAVVAKKKVTVIREGKAVNIVPEEIVLDDVVLIEAGDQIPNDGTILQTNFLEVDESLLTGESDQIPKTNGSTVMSGSFVTSGSAYVRVDAVGIENYATKLSLEAKKESHKTSKLMRTIKNIIRVLTIVIVPLGAILFYTQYDKGIPLETAILGSTAAILGMIPEGLILLTSITFAVGSINLAKHKTLVQTLHSIETLARVDVLCLDKTGTITDGNITLEQLVQVADHPQNMEMILSHLTNSLNDSNPTALAIQKVCQETPVWQSLHCIPFSSQRKWSGASYEGIGSYVMGAPDFMFTHLSPEVKNQIDSYLEEGFRVLSLGYSKTFMAEAKLPTDLTCIGLLILSDNIRKNAAETFQYFADQEVEIKVISGDNPKTVSRIAKLAGILNAEKYIDMSQVKEDADYLSIAEEHAVFGRVSPYQKRELVRALHKLKKTVCMTGDGVNDVLALKEADCGVAVANGSAAARSVADFVLLDSDFSAMVEVLKEGRRVINNIENVASLYLVKTIYSTLLSLIFIGAPFTYPFSPLQMGPINTLTVGIPSFFLALKPDYRKVKGRFVLNVLENSVPAALAIIINIILLQLIGVFFFLPHNDIATMSVLLVGTCGFIVLHKVSRPFNAGRVILFIFLLAGFLSCLTFFGSFFEFADLFTRNVFFYVPLIFLSRDVFMQINRFVLFVENKIIAWKTKRQSKAKKIL